MCTSPVGMSTKLDLGDPVDKITLPWIVDLQRLSSICVTWKECQICSSVPSVKIHPLCSLNYSFLFWKGPLYVYSGIRC